MIDRRKDKGGLGTHHDLLNLYLASGEKDPELYTLPTIIGITRTTVRIARVYLLDGHTRDP